MSEHTQLILTAPPFAARKASTSGLPIGHIAYRIGPGGRLLRANIPLDLRGGLMVIDGSCCDGRGDTTSLCQQIIRECASRNFDGVILDFESTLQSFLVQLLTRLSPLLFQRGWPLYVTENYADISSLTRVIIPSALSGGSLRKRLSEAIEQYGTDRVALGVQRTAEDFTLPSPSGCGTPLSREELNHMIRQRGASIFFSDELCAHYFTYMSRDSGAHFVLFDNAASIRKKIQIARAMELCACILAWPDVDNIITAVLDC